MRGTITVLYGGTMDWIFRGLEILRVPIADQLLFHYFQYKQYFWNSIEMIENNIEINNIDWKYY